MNQDLLLRLFRTIEGDSNDDIIKVAQKIVESEEKSGHNKIAIQLKHILSQNVKNYHQFNCELKKMLPKGVSIPTDRRFNVPLATAIERDSLKHDMVLVPEVEEKINRIEKEYVARERLSKYGLKPKRKILIYGAPGCGKSMSAERIAWNIGLPFLKVRFEAILSSFLGESATSLKKLFDSINNFPCVLLLDEFDFIAKGRGNGQDVGEMHRIVNILLTLMEEYDAPGLIIATTNFEGIIDKALFRRFDDIIEMPKPQPPQIRELLIQTLSSINVGKINWNKIIKELNESSAAMVVKVANDAAKLSIIEHFDKILEAHLVKALEQNKSFI